MTLAPHPTHTSPQYTAIFVLYYHLTTDSIPPQHSPSSPLSLPTSQPTSQPTRLAPRCVPSPPAVTVCTVCVQPVPPHTRRFFLDCMSRIQDHTVVKKKEKEKHDTGRPSTPPPAASAPVSTLPCHAAPAPAVRLSMIETLHPEWSFWQSAV
jgi:hypothetical protein